MAGVACEFGTQDSCPAAIASALLVHFSFRSKIHCITFVLEYDAKESGDPEADDSYFTAYWIVSCPENLGALDELYMNAGTRALDILFEREEEGLG